METRLIITKLAQSKDFGQYLEFRITVGDRFIQMIKDCYQYWDLIKDNELLYMEHVLWFKQIKLK